MGMIHLLDKYGRRMASLPYHGEKKFEWVAERTCVIASALIEQEGKPPIPVHLDQSIPVMYSNTLTLDLNVMEK